MRQSHAAAAAAAAAAAEAVTALGGAHVAVAPAPPPLPARDTWRRWWRQAATRGRAPPFCSRPSPPSPPPPQQMALTRGVALRARHSPACPASRGAGGARRLRGARDPCFFLGSVPTLLSPPLAAAVGAAGALTNGVALRARNLTACAAFHAALAPGGEAARAIPAVLGTVPTLLSPSLPPLPAPRWR